MGLDKREAGCWPPKATPAWSRARPVRTHVRGERGHRGALDEGARAARSTLINVMVVVGGKKWMDGSGNFTSAVALCSFRSSSRAKFSLGHGAKAVIGILRFY